MSLPLDIRIARMRKGLMQKDLAEIVEVSPNWISLIENGHRRCGLGLLERIAEATDHVVGIGLEEVREE